MEFLYSVNNEQFYYRNDDNKKICLTKEQYLDEEFENDYIVTGEYEGWDENFVKSLYYKERK